MQLRRPAALVLGALLLLSSAANGASFVAASGPAGPSSAGAYIVILQDDADVDALLSGYARRIGLRPSQTYRNAARGFAALLDGRQLAALRADPAVALIEPDRVVQLQAQVLPTGVNRVQADLSATARIDGIDDRVDADIAIIDTGIQPNHPDLNVAGGYNCTGSNRADWADKHGHGTHVAGIAAALDNDIGVVGVAPGARLWAVRVFNKSGFSRISWIVCGIDWVTAQTDPSDPLRPLFEVANMSLRDAGTDDGNCGYTNGDAQHRAICRSVAAGVTYVVAAGNDRSDANRWIPAAYDEVITVSALADFNGVGGGGAAWTCSADVDDTFADFSNFGTDVDLIAPGKCIYSTYKGSSYATMSGTSMATPAVAGGVALYAATHPGATPADVRTALLAAGTRDWFTDTDPDGFHEPLLDVSSFGP